METEEQKTTALPPFVIQTGVALRSRKRGRAKAPEKIRDDKIIHDMEALLVEDAMIIKVAEHRRIQKRIKALEKNTNHKFRALHIASHKWINPEVPEMLIIRFF